MICRQLSEKEKREKTSPGCYPQFVTTAEKEEEKSIDLCEQIDRLCPKSEKGVRGNYIAYIMYARMCVEKEGGCIFAFLHFLHFCIYVSTSPVQRGKIESLFYKFIENKS